MGKSTRRRLKRDRRGLAVKPGKRLSVLYFLGEGVKKFSMYWIFL
jgi:hypothetical protein